MTTDSSTVVGMLIALEGLDGAGKRTLVGKVVARLEADGLDVATLDFPRYGTSIHADLASEALKGAHGRPEWASVHAMAGVALDRRALPTGCEANRSPRTTS